MGQYYTAVISRSKTSAEFVDGIIGSMNPHTFDHGAKLMEHSWFNNEFMKAVCAVLAERPARVVWAGDYADPEPDGTLLYEMVDEDDALPIPNISNTPFYLVNFEKRQWVDLKKLPVDRYGWHIHPLPLLVAEGNGRGGGDYHGRSQDRVGTWSRDLLGMVLKAPEPFDGWEELVPDFNENR